MNTTFADLLTPAGVVIAAGIITTLVELVKRTFPGIAGRLSGAAMAFIGSGVLYVIAGVATNATTFDAALQVFLAWLATATSAVGIYSTTTYVASRRST